MHSIVELQGLYELREASSGSRTDSGVGMTWLSFCPYQDQT
jgi:hypothetical protein